LVVNSIFDKSPMDDYIFISEELKRKNINVQLINPNEINKQLKENNKSHEAFVQYLTATYSKYIFNIKRYSK
jgi:hypothetical protein